MRVGNAWLMVGLMVTLPLAGCLGGSGSSGLDSGDIPAGTAGSGSISGVVLDDTMLPVAGAKVALLTPNGTAVYRIVNTTDAGKFTFGFVPAQEYLVEVRAPGFKALAIPVNLEPDERLDQLTFHLEPGFADVAYFVTDILTKAVGGGTIKYGFHCSQTPWQPYLPNNNFLQSLVGKHCVGGNFCFDEVHAECEQAASGCNGSYSKETGVEDNGYGGDSYEGGYRDLLLPDPDSWKTQLAEVTWEPSSSVSGQGVLFEILGPNVTNSDGGHNSRCGGINQSDPRDFLIVSDEPPFRIDINDDLLAARGVTEEDRCCDWRWRLFPGWCDLGNCARWGPDVNALGVLAPTQVDIYYTVFFEERAPPDWTALPDQ